MSKEVKFEPGWLEKQIAKCIAMIDSLPPKVRDSLNQPTSKRSSRSNNE